MFNLLHPLISNHEQLCEWTDEKLFYKYRDTQKVYYFDVIYNRLHKKVFAKCISFLKSEEAANDAMQDIFITILLKASKFEGRSKLSTWIYSITYNHCIDILRKRKKEKRVLVEDWSKYNSMVEVDDHLLLQTKVKHLKVILERLAEKDKMILLMKYQDEMSIKEIMVLVDKSESAVKMMLNRAKQKFKILHSKYVETIG